MTDNEPWVSFRNEHGCLIHIRLEEGEDGKPEPIVTVEAIDEGEGYLSMDDIERCKTAASVLISGQLT